MKCSLVSVIGNRFVPSALHETLPEEAGCMPGTRLGVLSMFMEWAQNDPKRIFWLAGLAGTGKTSIAVTLCNMLRDEPNILLGGTFFCSRTANIDELTDARYIFPTLAISLAEQSPVFAAALACELTADSRAALKPITNQIASLLQRPLASLALWPVPIVFLIDALDECSDENEVKKLLQAISTLVCDAKIKFIVTSRPETHISTSPISITQHNIILRLHTIDKSEVTVDIRLCIEDAFSKHLLDETWYTEQDVGLLASRADGLFIFASTVISYVLDTESVEERTDRLRTALTAMKDSEVATAPLDAIYESVLTRASNRTKVEPKELEVTQKVLACILTARMPLSITALAELVGLKPDRVRGSLRRLRAVIHVPEETNQAGLRTLHASFADYLFERAVPSSRIARSLGDGALAHGCQRVMAEQLHFNFWRIRSSYEPTPPVRSRVLALSLEYACMHWTYHVPGLADPSMLDDVIYKDFRPRMLFWLEVMSVLNQVWRAARMLLFAAATVCLRSW